MRAETRTAAEGSCTFPTPLGRVRLSWTRKGVSRLTLPDRRLRDGAGVGEAAPPPEAARLIREIQAYFRGEAVSPRAPLDLAGTSPFERSVYAAARAIPRGRVKTYGEIARTIGRPGSARAVGGALGRNPIPLLIPCHRVVAAAGLGGFSARGGVSLKGKMIALERRGRDRGAQIA